MTRVAIPGTRLFLTVEDADVDTPELRAYLEACAVVLGPQIAAAHPELRPPPPDCPTGCDLRCLDGKPCPDAKEVRDG